MEPTSNNPIENKPSERKYKSFPAFPDFNEKDYIVEYKSKEKINLKVKKGDGFILSFSNVNIPISKIDSIEDQTNSPAVTISYGKNNYPLVFNTLMEKYHFKSLLYNVLLNQLEKSFFSQESLQLSVVVITWNIANTPCVEDIGPLFDRTPLDTVDIFAIGIQECAMMQASKWQACLREKITSYDFVEIAHESLLQMFLIVFIKAPYRNLVSRIEKATKPMGFANVVGNKGGIVISMFVMGFHFIFIDCHLAPKMYKILERMKMAKQLIDSIKVGDKFADLDIQSDYVFWCGDLNYRVDCTYEDTIDVLKKRKMATLLEKDQLLKVMQNNEIFCQYIEKTITFLPTYRRAKDPKPVSIADSEMYRSIEEENKKYEEPIDFKTIFSDKENQSPSWCDRILVKSTRQVDIESYDSVYRLRQSDHLPVAGKYSIFLSLPILNNVEQSLMDSVVGELKLRKVKFTYKSILLNEIFENKSSFDLMISAYFFINEKPSESNTVVLDKITSDTINMILPDISIPIPPQLIFDYPQMKANNIFFVLKVKGEKDVDIGFAKYSFEDIELNRRHNIMSHKMNLDLFYQLTIAGSLSFEANYFCDDSSFN